MKMNGRQRGVWLDEMVFEASLEAFLEGATDEEIGACRRGVMHDG